VECQYRADLRFRGQDFTLTILLEPEWLADPKALVERMRKRFDATHTQLYGHGSEDRPLEIVTYRCRAIGRVPRPRWFDWTVSKPAVPKKTRQVYFKQAGDFVKTSIFERDLLAKDQEIRGPAIVEEWTTTTVVPPGWYLKVDRLGNLEMRSESR
jgi:N-methylhydantoinase A